MNCAWTAWELSSPEKLMILPLYLVFAFFHQKCFDLVVICIRLELNFALALQKEQSC